MLLSCFSWNISEMFCFLILFRIKSHTFLWSLIDPASILNKTVSFNNSNANDVLPDPGGPVINKALFSELKRSIVFN